MRACTHICTRACTHTRVQTCKHTDTLWAISGGHRNSPAAVHGSSRPLWALIKTLSLLSPGPLQCISHLTDLLVFSGLTPWVQFLLEHHNLKKGFPWPSHQPISQTHSPPSLHVLSPTLSYFSESILNYLKIVLLLIWLFWCCCLCLQLKCGIYLGMGFFSLLISSDETVFDTW